MPATAPSTKEMKRVNLSLPVSLYDALSEIVQEEELTYTAALRQAVASWLDQRTKAKMVEGYKALAQENLDMLAEFELVDEEAW
jgi:metal-responsive CopG/Arc/MetJ family transcriptional regulator